MSIMKNSGIEWIGKVPLDWEIKRIEKCFYERRVKVSDIEFEPLSVTKKGIVKQLETAAKTNAHDERKLVCKGDFVINSRSDRKQSCGLSDFDGSVSLINTVLINRFYYPGYLKYILNNYGFAEEFYRWGTGIVADLWSTNYNKMKKISLPVPPLVNQQKIASYLEQKVATIDNIVEKTNVSIEEYKKLKQSIITEVVTKGLNPNVKMKDSGIEWIGKIPAHWNITKLKYLYKVTLGKMLCSEKINNDYTLENYLKAQNIKWNFVDNNSIDKMWFSTSEKSNYLLNQGDILVSEGGDAGTVAIYRNEAYPCYIQNAVHRISAINRNSNEFLYYWQYSLYNLGYIDMVCNKATLKHYTKDKVENTLILKLPQSEQLEIANYLNTKIEKIDSIIKSKEILITELESYKKSLIYEVVTGKKEVK